MARLSELGAAGWGALSMPLLLLLMPVVSRALVCVVSRNVSISAIILNRLVIGI